MQDRRFQAILLPGGVLPAALAYPDLVRALGPDVDARYKELELYTGDEPPSGYGLDTEVQGVRRLADEAGFEQLSSRRGAGTKRGATTSGAIGDDSRR